MLAFASSEDSTQSVQLFTTCANWQNLPAATG